MKKTKFYVLSYHFIEDDYQDGVMSPDLSHIAAEIDTINERLQRGERLGGISLYVEEHTEPEHVINDEN